MIQTIVSRKPIGRRVVELCYHLSRSLSTETGSVCVMVHERNLLGRFIRRVEIALVEYEVESVDEFLIPSLKLNQFRGIMGNILGVLKGFRGWAW